jgi:hypothetical protein
VAGRKSRAVEVALIKIVSGGQTGVDRGTLDAALAADFPCGGWCPGDRAAEDGTIPERYPLVPLPNGDYRQRTRINVVDSDGYSSTGRAVRISYPRPAPSSQRRDSDSPHGLASVAASMRQNLIYEATVGRNALDAEFVCAAQEAVCLGECPAGVGV